MYKRHNTRLTEIDARLRKLGFKMDYDIGSIPGEGHHLIRLSNDELVSLDDDDSAAVPAEVLGMAKEWSDLVDDCSE